MTLSGGEPLFQYEFSLELCKKAKENIIPTAVETCGYTTGDKIKEISQYIDLFLFDYKETVSDLKQKNLPASEMRLSSII